MYASLGAIRQKLRGTPSCPLLVAISLMAATCSQAAEKLFSESTVGLPVRLEQLVLPGSELEPVPWEDKTAVILQVDRVYPHGTAFRYDLIFQGLEPGDYDLREFLRRKDGTSTADLPSLLVKIKSLLPLGQIQPNKLSFAPLPWLGGYRLLLIVVTVGWLAGLVWIIYPRRHRSEPTDADLQSSPSLAERLRPLVTQAMRGEISTAELAELERALEGYWRRRLGLEDLPPTEALAQLRSHAEAGPLVTQLETWLHRPGGDRDVDINALLSPYQNLSADALCDETAAALEIAR